MGFKRKTINQFLNEKSAPVIETLEASIKRFFDTILVVNTAKNKVHYSFIISNVSIDSSWFAQQGIRITYELINSSTLEVCRSYHNFIIADNKDVVINEICSFTYLRKALMLHLPFSIPREHMISQILFKDGKTY